MDHWDGITEEQFGTIQKARKRVIESIGKNMDLYGVTLSTGHLYGMMFFQDKPMTLDEMGQEMGMSKTSMSTGVRTLTDLKMVHQVWEKGNRKDLYEVETDWYQSFADFFDTKWRKSIEMNVHALRKSIAELQRLLEDDQNNEALKTLIAADIGKLDEAIRYYLWLGRLIDTFETGEIFKLVPKEETRS
ncbi:GbsR/MarR family transcriptional regulator [Paenibacillus contaminans]|uniref:HTH-type transcriptional regulator n=1 Tax=Paenibacillus contaminans TaxID=450362 RepID=A0A329MSH7_9BACL|nr:GbsR/MarR family transcriptional regulator [Paenibacillus contaminans]RAV22895.1 GbsR/MarR family transcriptional regulator [Paenibacillus contaminans]